MDSPRATGWLVLPARFIIGALFVFAGILKLQDPQAFAFAIKAFDILPDHLVVLATFVVPWIEIVAGLVLFFGFWVRTAAFLIALMLGAFLAGIISVLARNMDNVSCACFGKYEWPCVSPVGWCHVIRNSVLIVLALIPAILGPGPLTFDKESTK